MTFFGHPGTLLSAEEVHELSSELADLDRPMPTLVEPPQEPVSDPSNEKLVPILHDRIALLNSYRRAGWAQARPGCWLRDGALKRLTAVVDSLPPRWGLAIFDAWRPLELQADLYDTAYADETLPQGFVSPADPDARTPPPHLTGGVADLTLTLDSIPIALGCGFDDFTAEARADSFEATPGAPRTLRRALYWAMRGQDFVVLDAEWWHYEYGTRRWGAISGRSPRYGPTAPDQEAR